MLHPNLQSPVYSFIVFLLSHFTAWFPPPIYSSFALSSSHPQARNSPLYSAHFCIFACALTFYRRRSQTAWCGRPSWSTCRQCRAWPCPCRRRAALPARPRAIDIEHMLLAPIAHHSICKFSIHCQN